MAATFGCVKKMKTFMEYSDFKEVLSEIAGLLEEGGEHRTAASVRTVVLGSEENIDEFLASNELWGGAGSIADQSLVSDKTRRKALEDSLIRLGKLQLATGKTNPRTAMWVTAFERWQQMDVQ